MSRLAVLDDNGGAIRLAIVDDADSVHVWCMLDDRDFNGRPETRGESFVIGVGRLLGRLGRGVTS